jgi:hypothetical protein
MELEESDRSEREALGLSCLPSTKSTSVVDTAVERGLIDYHTDKDAITFTSKSVDDPIKDSLAQWLSNLFHYRAEHTFPFFTWHAASLTAGFVDGLEAALVTWKKEAYTEKETKYINLLDNSELDEESYEMIKGMPDAEKIVSKEEVEREVVVHDTWWIDQLKPGEELLWDYKIPYLDINLGQVALVKMEKSIQEVLDMKERGIFDKGTEDELKNYQQVGKPRTPDATTVANPQTNDLGEYNKLDVWAFFEKVSNKWMVSFSVEGKYELTSKPKAVNDIFFGGREVNRLPIVLGTMKMKLWEAVGRGLPETIAPIEDEWSDHRNALNDAAKMAIQGKYRIDPESDVFIDDLLNARAFKARQGEVEAIQTDTGVLTNLRASDPLISDMNELIPVSMSGRAVVPKGTDKTLGAVQMAQTQAQDKLSVQLLVRNETFMKPLLWLIAQLEFAFESDEVVMRLAGTKAGLPMNQPPFTTFVDGKPGIDISILDFDVDTQINVGMGSAPKVQKFNNLTQIIQFAKLLGKQVDNDAIFNQGVILAGYTTGQFDSKAPPPGPPPPEVKYQLDVKCTMQDLAMIDPNITKFLVQKLYEGQVGVKTTVQDDTQGQLNEATHNQNPNTMGSQAPDMTRGSAAQGMSQGGMQ